MTTLIVSLNTDNNPGGVDEFGDLHNAVNTMNQNLNTTSDDYAIVFSSPMTTALPSSSMRALTDERMAISCID